MSARGEGESAPPLLLAEPSRRAQIGRSDPGLPDQLADFNQVAVGVAHVAADLDAAVDRRGQKLRAAGAPLFVDGVDVGDADIQEGRDAIGMRWRRERSTSLATMKWVISIPSFGAGKRAICISLR